MRCAVSRSSRSTRFSRRARTRSSAMASSRRWSPADVRGPLDGAHVSRHDGAARVTATVERALAMHVARGSTVAVALSGGRDSVALLDATLDCAPPLALDVVALHVHHG